MVATPCSLACCIIRPMPSQPAHPLTAADEDRSGWRTRPHSQIGQNDVAALLDKEIALDEIAASVVDDVEELADAADEAAQALCDWEEHLAACTLQLHTDDVRSNEDLRKAMAIAHKSGPAHSKPGTPGRDLYRRHIATRFRVEVIKEAIRAKGTVSSDYQTLINGLRKATGLT